MSVLIKGMVHPESCYYCPFAEGTWGYNPPNRMRCLILGKDMPTDGRNVQTNHYNCPLIEVPDKHGRLIDADAALRSEQPPSCSDEMWNRTTLAKAINNAPTVIPSSNT